MGSCFETSDTRGVSMKLQNISSSCLDMSTPKALYLLVVLCSVTTLAFVTPFYKLPASTGRRTLHERPDTRLCEMATPKISEDSFTISRGVLLQQGIVGIAGLVSFSEPSSAGLFGGRAPSQIDPEDVPTRIMVGQTRFIKWSDISPGIAKMRSEAMTRFKATGAKGGREVASYRKIDVMGAYVTVGVEIDGTTQGKPASSAVSPAIGESFTASEITPPGSYVRATIQGYPSFLEWQRFVTDAISMGFKPRDPLALFEVYPGPEDDGITRLYLGILST